MASAVPEHLVVKKELRLEELPLRARPVADISKRRGMSRLRQTPRFQRRTSRQADKRTASELLEADVSRSFEKANVATAQSCEGRILVLSDFCSDDLDRP